MTTLDTNPQGFMDLRFKRLAQDMRALNLPTRLTAQVLVRKYVESGLECAAFHSESLPSVSQICSIELASETGIMLNVEEATGSTKSEEISFQRFDLVLKRGAKLQEGHVIPARKLVSDFIAEVASGLEDNSTIKIRGVAGPVRVKGSSLTFNLKDPIVGQKFLRDPILGQKFGSEYPVRASRSDNRIHKIKARLKREELKNCERHTFDQVIADRAAALRGSRHRL